MTDPRLSKIAHRLRLMNSFVRENRRLRKENAALLESVPQWFCERCRTVVAGPTKDCRCERCGRFMSPQPHRIYDQLRQRIAELEFELKQARDGL